MIITQDTSGYTLTRRDKTVERYNASGKLIIETSPTGQTTNYGFDTSGRLATVTDAFGHTLTFGYNTNNHISTVTDSAGQVIGYTYDINNNLTRVGYPDATAKIYHYNEPVFTSGANLPNHLTGISYVDSAGVTIRYATYAYDTNGKAITTQHAQTDNGAPQEKFTLAYNSDTQTTVTDPVNMQEVMTFSIINLGVKNLVNKVNQSDSKSVAQTFDANNNLTCRKDEENRVTLYSYNATNQRTSMTEGLSGSSCSTCLVNPANCNGGGVGRVTTYNYLSPTLDLPRFIRRPSVASGQTFETELVYGDAGHPNLPTQIIQRGYTPAGASVSRTVTLGYNTSGQVTSINGPRTDVNDVTTLEYYVCTTGGACGQLQRITNALGQITTYDLYDANGRLKQMTDPNGLKTSYIYDARGRALTITQTPTSGPAAVTQYSYTPWGDVSQVIDPDSVRIDYGYDAAHYLRTITDTAGNQIRYAYDLKGNRAVDNTYDPSGVLTRQASYAYDLRNHLATISSGSVTALVADAVGNLTNETDGNYHATQHQYDALNRLFRTVNALNQNTDYAYDINDRTTSVTAPNNLTTQYQYDDLGNRLREDSPDRGTTNYDHDAAGNLRTLTNQIGQVTTYTYDALNRVASKQSSDSSTPAYAYVYDTCRVGALCAIQQNTAAHLSYGYDGLGRLNLTTDVSSGSSLTSQYAYSPGGRVSQMTYPNNVVVNYTYDALGKVSRASTTANGVTTVLADNFQHHPFGPIKSFRFGNGIDYFQRLDTAYRPQNYNLGYRSKFVYYDAADNIRELNDSYLSSQTFTYDALNQLTAAADSQTGSYGSLAYTYVKNGHRKTETRNGVTDTYVYYGTNLLSYNNTQWWIYFGTGNVRSGSALGYLTYDGYERVLGILAGGYGYNAWNQRTRKTVGGVTTTFHYGPQGELLYEAGGGDTRAYIYVNTMLLARVDNNGPVYYYHTDHLGTPHSMTNSAGDPVWRVYYEPFGKAILINQTITNHVRLPGQYYDSETGLHYNMTRYYDPRIGRYISSDPIGLRGGLNTYLYAQANPLRYTDPTGLLGVDTIINWLLKQVATRVATGAAEKIAGDPLKRSVKDERQALEKRDEQQYWQCVQNCRNSNCLNKENPETWQSTWDQKQACEASCQERWKTDTAREKTFYP